MTDEQFEANMRVLIDKIEALPPESREAIQPMVQKTIDRHLKIRKNCQAAREAVAKWQGQMQDLGVAIKYTMFDLEATRRELKEERDKNVS